jgi:tetratricopeptide (TPR) repeat protein
LKVAALFLKGHKGRSVSDYMASVEKDRARLRLEGRADHDVLAVVGQSVQQLQAEDGELCENWRELSVFPSRFDAAAAAAVWGVDDKDTGSEYLTRLETRGLIEAVAEDRYRLHDLLRDVAREGWSGERAEAAAQRHAQYFVSLLGQANDLYLQGGAAIASGLTLFDRERTNIEAGQRWASARVAKLDKAARLAAAYANAGAYVLSIRLHPRERIKWSEAAFEGNRRIRDRRGEGNALGNLGLAYAALGETGKAIDYHEKNLTIAREIGDRRSETNALCNLGNAYAALGESRKAIDYHEKALVISREIGDRRGEGNALGNLGLVYAALGETRKAIDCYKPRLTIAREIGDRLAEGAVLGSLGLAYAALGQRRKAINYYEQQLAITREIGDGHGESNALNNLGLAYAALGRPRDAIDYYERGLTIAHEIGDRRGEGAALGNLGNAYADLGETRKAIENHEKSLVISREIGDRRGVSATLGNLGNAYYRLGETRKAIDYQEQALVISREIEDRHAEGATLGNLGLAYARLGETHKAIEYHEKRMAIAREIGDRRGEGNALANLGVALKGSDPEKACAYWKEALAVYTVIEDPNAARVAKWLAELDEEQD